MIACYDRDTEYRQAGDIRAEFAVDVHDSDEAILESSVGKGR